MAKLSKKSPVLVKNNAINPDEILNVIAAAEKLFGWNHLDNKARAAAITVLVVSVVALVLGILGIAS